jgi:hypothetical protein
VLRLQQLVIRLVIRRCRRSFCHHRHWVIAIGSPNTQLGQKTCQPMFQILIRNGSPDAKEYRSRRRKPFDANPFSQDFSADVRLSGIDPNCCEPGW